MRRSERSQPFSSALGIALVLVIVAVLLFRGHIESLLRSLWATAAVPVARTIQPRGTDLTDQESADALAICLVDGKKLRAENARLVQLKAENEALREILNFQQATSRDIVISHIVARHDKQGVRAATIDKGSNQGVKIGYPVIASSGALIGSVVEVTPASSVVLALQDPNSSVSVTLSSYQKPLGILKGRQGTTLAMELIPNDTVLRKDELIITGGAEEFIPYGLLVGKIDHLEDSSDELFQKAVILSEDLLDEQRVVSVVVP
ncbi:MAG: rod shape-determining protein MreC [Candidatus Jacksonbacteria bacterium]|jgi:rod shape-determining protein MreC|nr:rod shape-determining protein MreC [Candidatus Jacksonbacteria bacterium]